MNIHDQDNFLGGKNEGIEEGIQQGLQQGAYEKAIETAKNMLLKNISVEVIADCTGLTNLEVEQLSQEIQSVV